MTRNDRIFIKHKSMAGLIRWNSSDEKIARIFERVGLSGVLRFIARVFGLYGLLG